MLNDFQAAFRASKIQKALILCLFLISSWSVWAYFFGTTRWCLLTGVLAAVAWSWREPNTVQYLRIDDEFQAWILLNNQSDWHQAQLLSGSLIHRWGCFLQWQVDERVMWQVVLPDMLDSETFRRLRVWAMFGQKV